MELFISVQKLFHDGMGLWFSESNGELRKLLFISINFPQILAFTELSHDVQVILGFKDTFQFK